MSGAMAMSTRCCERGSHGKLSTLAAPVYLWAGKRDDHLVPFEGTINWSALVMAMEKVGYDGVWMFEIGAPTPGAGYDDMLAKAAAARARLEKLGEPIQF